MRSLSLFTLLVTLAAGILPKTTFGAPSMALAPQPVDSTKIERWRDLPPETRHNVRKWARTLKQLPEDRRRALLERVRTMKPEELRTLGQRMRQFQRKSKSERQKLSHRARMLRQIERTLSVEERAELRRLSPKGRQRQVQEHSRRLMKRFRRAMTHRQREELRRADRTERRKQFIEYLQSTRTEPTESPRVERPTERRWASAQRVRRLRSELEKLPPDVRRSLLRGARTRDDRVPPRLRREFESLTPRERSLLRRVDGKNRAPHGRDGRGWRERRESERPSRRSGRP